MKRRPSSPTDGATATVTDVTADAVETIGRILLPLAVAVAVTAGGLVVFFELVAVLSGGA